MHIELATQDYPLTLDAIRQKRPRMSIPANAIEIPGFAPVAPSIQPVPAPGNKVVEAAPVETTPGNWQQQWVEAPLTQAEIDMVTQATLKGLTDAVQRHLDNTARQRNYDGILSACTYAASTNPQFATEGQACMAWRDAVWAACYQVNSEVQNGTRAVPTEAELLALLPTMTWPA